MADPELDKLVRAVQKNPRYAAIDQGVVAAVAAEMMQKGFSTKETVKRTRAKLHQIGGAYQQSNIPYEVLHQELKQLPKNLQAPEVKAFCLHVLPYHRSTNERINTMQTIYPQLFDLLPPIHSILDLASGLNPLSLPWMPIPSNCTYSACDIYPEMLRFLSEFLGHFGIEGQVFTCDLAHSIPSQSVDLALLLKTIPCLEQLDKSIGVRLLSQLKAKVVIVSFPIRSLSGRSKDMPRHYESHFMELLEPTNWKVTPIPTKDELFFLLEK